MLVQDAVEEIPRVANQIREHTPVVVPAISEGFRIGCALSNYLFMLQIKLESFQSN
jgi:hypothetical protein